MPPGRSQSKAFYHSYVQILFRELLVLLRHVLQKSYRSIVVMGSGIDHTVFIIIVGQIIAVIARIKSKLQDLHSRVACPIHQSDHAGSQESEILRDDLLFTQLLLHHSKQFIARSLLPVPGL